MALYILGLFFYVCCCCSSPGHVNHTDHQRISYEAALQGLVLLKNEDIYIYIYMYIYDMLHVYIYIYI